MKINLSSTAGVCWAEISRICHDSVVNIDHSNFKLLQAFLSDPIFEVYQEELGRIFDQAMVTSIKLQAACDVAVSTAQKIRDYCFGHMNPSCNPLAAQGQQKQSSAEFEKRSDDEPDLLALLNSISNK